ncbi:MAG: N-formylglutamate amidohydrolase [Rhodobacteraceae bacterium]|nr:N-formylglutamate amidohydrolase [Paracoccaceae bacterium]
MTEPRDQILLSKSDLPTADVVNRDGRAAICLVCEHASASIPEALGDLGLSEGDRFSHAVWDPGAENLARELSTRLDAPLVLSRVSRLVYDCNRPPEREDCMPSQVEKIVIPGNAGLSTEARAARTEAVYHPFHRTVEDLLDGFGTPPAFVTIHTFAPEWFGVPRAAEIGLLHDKDASLAVRMLAAARTGYRTELNVPYSAADGVTHTLSLHANPRGLQNVMIEVRNDLVADETGVSEVASAIEHMLRLALNPEEDAA